MFKHGQGLLTHAHVTCCNKARLMIVLFRYNISLEAPSHCCIASRRVLAPTFPAPVSVFSMLSLRDAQKHVSDRGLEHHLTLTI